MGYEWSILQLSQLIVWRTFSAMDTWVNTNATQRNSMAVGQALEEFSVHAGVKNKCRVWCCENWLINISICTKFINSTNKQPAGYLCFCRPKTRDLNNAHWLSGLFWNYLPLMWMIVKAVEVAEVITSWQTNFQTICHILGIDTNTSPVIMSWLDWCCL